MTETCKDTHCPIHSSLRTHGRQFTGTVIESKAQKTATIEWQRRHYLPKYERYEQRRTKVKAHNPECINAQKGDKVIIKECRHLSKTKNFVITQTTGKDITFLEREHLLEESHVKKNEPTQNNPKKDTMKTKQKAEESNETN